MTGLLQSPDEIFRTLERNDFARWPNDFRQIDSRIARAGADIENAFANCHTGPLPAIQNYRTPHAMLQPEPR
jgi:hypothetical protein